MGLFDKLMGRTLPERQDARRIYFRLLEQSRSPLFFGTGRVGDDYDGRIDMLTLHMAIMLFRLRREDEDGKLLSQALFDEMKDDFEIALREEGISDTGVKKRIKPMISHFYDRVKRYSEAFDSDNPQFAIAAALTDRTMREKPEEFEIRVADYSLDFLSDLNSLDLKTLIKARFKFPDV